MFSEENGTDVPEYDLNIWDRRGYETDYAEEGWYIDVYEMPSDGGSFGSGEYKPELGFPLTDKEARDLTLGVRTEDGGDYCPDVDFWLDVHGFFSVYKNIPARVAKKLRKLEG